MKKIDLSLNYTDICIRIEEDIGKIRPSKWAEIIKVSKNVVSNIHGEKGTKHPSLEYIIAVARVTGKPIEWYLYGPQDASETVQESASPYNQPEEYHCKFCGDMSPEIKDLCKSMKDIIESGHPEIVPALESNIKAFKCSIDKERKQDEDIKKLKAKVNHLEKLLDPGQNTGTGRAAGTGSKKKKI